MGGCGSLVAPSTLNNDGWNSVDLALEIRRWVEVGEDFSRACVALWGVVCVR